MLRLPLPLVLRSAILVPTLVWRPLATGSDLKQPADTTPASQTVLTSSDASHPMNNSAAAQLPPHVHNAIYQTFTDYIIRSRRAIVISLLFTLGGVFYFLKFFREPITDSLADQGATLAMQVTSRPDVQDQVQHLSSEVANRLLQDERVLSTSASFAKQLAKSTMDDPMTLSQLEHVLKRITAGILSDPQTTELMTKLTTEVVQQEHTQDALKNRVHMLTTDPEVQAMVTTLLKQCLQDLLNDSALKVCCFQCFDSTHVLPTGPCC